MRQRARYTGASRSCGPGASRARGDHKTVPLPDRVRLLLPFDATALAAEVAAIPASAWVPHFNTATYEGEWSGLALRSPGGSTKQLYPGANADEPFADTELLGASPACQDALAQFRCPVLTARLLALAPGALIKEHSDLRLGWEDGEVRIHVPVLTSDGVEFFLDGAAVTMRAGEAWYLDLNLPHRAANRSSQPRVHLVVDCVVDDWLDSLLKASVALGPAALE
jgi:Aspartyl/Asparaginyl beta-hydroxylase